MTDQPIGTLIAGYRIESVLGHGGMAVVYRAEDIRLGRKVALKLLSPALSDDERFQQRFVQESRLAASLDHPNIIPIYEAGNADGVLFIAMRYVVGTDLKVALAASHTLAPSRTLRLFEQIGEALDTAHSRGLVHRDVKPGNILLTAFHERDDHVYLTDFGLTKRASSLSGLTGTGHFLGTIDYVAPEQIAGKPVDARTDIYALGCVLYECLTGRVPFPRDDDAASLWAHLVDVPPPVSAVRDDTARAVDDVVGRAMAKAPEDRYDTCHDLVTELRSAFAAAASTSRPGGVTTAPPGRFTGADDQETRAPSEHPSFPAGTFPPGADPDFVHRAVQRADELDDAYDPADDEAPAAAEDWADADDAQTYADDVDDGRHRGGVRAAIRAHKWPILVAALVAACLVAVGSVLLLRSGGSSAKALAQYTSGHQFRGFPSFVVSAPADWQAVDDDTQGGGVDAALTPGGATVANLFFTRGALDSWAPVAGLLGDNPTKVTGVYVAEILATSGPTSLQNLESQVTSLLPTTAEFDGTLRGQTVAGMHSDELAGTLVGPAGPASAVRFLLDVVQYRTPAQNATMLVLFFAAPGSFDGERATFERVLHSIRFT